MHVGGCVAVSTRVGVVEKARELVMEMRFLRGKLEEEVWRGRSRRLGVGCRAAATF